MNSIIPSSDFSISTISWDFAVASHSSPCRQSVHVQSSRRRTDHPCQSQATPRPSVPMFACSVAAASLVSPAVQRSSVAFARARTARASAPDDDAASPTDSSLLDAFQERIDEEGGATRLRLSTDASRLSRGAGKIIGDAGSAVNKALDLDGQAAEKNYPGRVGTPGGVLETGGWRLTVGFAAATIVFALYAAATTDFGDGGADGGPAVLPATRRVVANIWENFGKMLLVFGCIGTDFLQENMRFLQHFSKSTRFSN